MATLRPRLLSALVTQLEQIRIPDGFATDAGQRVFEWRDALTEPVQPEEMECVVWRDTEEEVTPLSAAVHECRLSVEVLGFCSLGDLSAERARALLGDLHQAIGLDPTLGGLALVMLPQSAAIEIDRQNQRTAAARLRLVLVYRTPDWDASIQHLSPV